MSRRSLPRRRCARVFRRSRHRPLSRSPADESPGSETQEIKAHVHELVLEIKLRVLVKNNFAVCYPFGAPGFKNILSLTHYVLIKPVMCEAVVAVQLGFLFSASYVEMHLLKRAD